MTCNIAVRLVLAGQPQMTLEPRQLAHLTCQWHLGLLQSSQVSPQTEGGSVERRRGFAFPKFTETCLGGSVRQNKTWEQPRHFKLYLSVVDPLLSL